MSVRSLGVHALKDIDERVELFQVIGPGLRADFPPPRTAGSHPTNLPPRQQPLIGRDTELAALTELLARDNVSLVTLTGPGGTGKTRLALATGAKLLPSFADGVFFVDLSALADPALVIGAIAQALSLRESPGRSLQKTLREHLSSTEMLLILDNFEQVMGAAREVSTLVTAAPAIKVLVTSRETLRVRGEKEFSVAPLAVPHSSDDPEAVADSPAVALFLSRAKDVRPDLEPGPSDLSLVADICRRLDGLPLAIELAAARVKVLSLPALNERLAHGLKVLTSGRRDASERQRTLRGAIAWSYDLLAVGEETLFRRLGLFAGGFSLEAAEAVCDRGDLDLDVLDGLASLVDKSLVRTDELRERFSMLETIREFALETLEESGEGEDLRRAHAEFFRALAEEAEPHLVGRHQKDWLDRLERDLDNIRAALRWSFLTRRDLAVRTAAGVRRLWAVRGYLSEGHSWLTRALAVAPANSGVTVMILRGLATIVQMQGDNDEAERLASEGLDLSTALGDSEGTISFLVTLGLVAEEGRDFDAAEARFEDAVEVARRHGPTSGLSKLINNLGSVALARDELERAERLFNDSLELQREQPDEESRALALLNLGLVALRRGSRQTAWDLIVESLASSAALGQSEFIVSNLEILATIVVAEGEAREAAQLLGLSDVLQSSTGFSLPAFERELRNQTLETIQQTIDAAALERALEEGRASDVGDVVHRLRARAAATVAHPGET